MRDNIRETARINDILRFKTLDIMAFTDFLMGDRANKWKRASGRNVIYNVQSIISNRGTMYNYCVESASPGRLNAYAYSKHVIDELDEHIEFVGDFFNHVVLSAIDEGLPPDFAAQNYMIEYDHHKTPRSIIRNSMME
jgi:hypothetical protein